MYGYSLGDWDDKWDKFATEATDGNWMKRDVGYRQRSRADVAPNTSSRHD